MKISHDNMKTPPRVVICLALTGLIFFTGPVYGENEIIRQGISAAGGQGSSTSYDLTCTLAQTVVGNGASSSYETWLGIWPYMTPGSDCGLPGDANADANVNVGDAVYIINYVFKGGAPPPNLNEGDANGDCGVNVGDAVYLISYIFKGGPAPVCGCAG